MIQNTPTLKQWSKAASAAVLMTFLLQLSGCSSPVLRRAPVEDRNMGVVTQPQAQSPYQAPGTVIVPSKPSTDYPTYSTIESKPLPNSLNSQFAGRPGYYIVKPGDTVMQIGRTSNQNWRDIVKWNSLESANQIEVGQVLRVAPPDGVAVAPVKPPVVVTPIGPVPSTSISASRSPLSPLTTATQDDEIAFSWPSMGSVISGFDEVKSKGLKMAGKLGDPVYASADGRVVYAGTAVRGYGNLVILKHNETYLTAYAHNQTLLVKEDQTVRRGQRIAEMGSSDADRVMLRFEIRRSGKPVDPAKYLPAR